MELLSKILVYKVNETQTHNQSWESKAKHTTNPEKHVIAVGLPLRMRVANLGGIAARNEKLNALKASALRADIQRVEQMMEGLPMIQKALVVDASQQLKQDIAKLAKAGG